MRTTTPAASSRGTSLQELEGLARGEAQRVEDLAGVDHRLEPRARLAGALHGQEQREQAVALRLPGVLAQRVTEREMLGLAVGGELPGVGGDEGEGRLVVLAVQGEVEVDAAHEVPRRAEAPEQFLRAEPGARPLVVEGGADLLPQRLEDRGAEVLRARHRRRGRGQRQERLARRRGSVPAPASRRRLRGRAERVHEEGAQLAPIREHGGQRRADLAGAELQQPVAGPAGEGLPQPRLRIRRQRRRVVH